MGAYTAATKTRFNSLPDAEFVVHDSSESHSSVDDASE
jgi:hypothetical protein